MDKSIVCCICGFKGKSHHSLSAHIRNRHSMTVKDYFDKYIEPWGHKCIRCGKPTQFQTLGTGYRQACNDVLCMRDARRHTCFEVYGDATYNNPEKQLAAVKNISEEEKDRRMRKSRATKKERYGDEDYRDVEKMRATCKSKYGVDNVFKADVIKEKIRQIHRAKRGVDYPSQSPECREKSRATMMKHYGVATTGESKELQEKARQTRMLRYGDPNYRNSEKIKAVAASRTSEEWQRIIDKRRKTCLAKYGVDTPFGFCKKPAAISSLSRRVKRVLDAAEVPYIQELRINFKERKEYRDFRAYDFAFGKVILELNGDYFHANPSIYKPTDVISIRHVLHTAQSIWNDDKVKRELAEQHGYQVVYLWETDMKKMKDKELLDWIVGHCKIQKGKS